MAAVCEEGTIRSAAQKLGKSYQAVSKSILKLEEELGVQLFSREGNDIKPNNMGRLTEAYARSILNRIEIIRLSSSRFITRSRYASIGACSQTPITVFQRICDRMASDRFRPEKYEIDTEVSYDEVRLVTEFGCFNYSILILDHPLSGKDIIVKEIFTEHLYLAVEKEHELAERTEVNFAELNGKMILAERNMDGWQKYIDIMLLKGARIVCLDETEYEFFQKSGSNFQLRSRTAIERYKDSEELVYIPVADQEAHRTFYAHYRRGDVSAERLIREAGYMPLDKVR